MRTLNDDVVRMGNQIAGEFRHLPADAAASAVGAHIRNYWERRMQEKLIEQIELGTKDLDPILIAAATHLRPKPKPRT